jgi:hypothetical protein
VQQVTSSIIYSSGSNNFGCDLNSRQTFTGSVLITGSLTNTGATCFVGNTIVSTVGNTTLTINGTSGVPALSFTNTGGTNNIYGGVGSVANITLAPGDVNAVKIFAAGCVSCFAGAITANGGLLIAGSPTGYPLGELQFNLTTNNSYSGISTLGTGTTTLYFDHRATSNTGNFVFRNGTAAANTLLTIAGSGAITATNTINVEQSNSAASTQMVISNTSNASATTKTSQLLFKISDTAGTQKNSAYIQAIPDGVNVLDAHLAFGTRLSDSDSNEKMRITAGGNVGIGTCSPAQSLEVNGNILASSTGKIGFRYSSGDGNYYSYLRSGTAGSIGPIILGGGFESGGAANEAIRFVTNAAPGERTSLSIYNAGIARFGFTVCAPCFGRRALAAGYGSIVAGRGAGTVGANNKC